LDDLFDDLPSPASTDVSQELPINVWLVGQDASPTQRKGRYVPASYAHPAKMLPELARKLISTYTNEGDLVVDPMSGVGTTGVEAIWLGRQYVGLEVEPDYVALQTQNLALARSQAGAQGPARVVQADARAAFGVSDAAIVAFSPPYQDAIHPQYDELGRIERKIASGTASLELRRRYAGWDKDREQANAGMRPIGYSRDSHNVGHLEGAGYWQAMRAIYTQAFATLREGGYLAVVTKDQRVRKTGELTNLYADTVAVGKSVGFALHQHIVALLCRLDPVTGQITPRTSHWQRMAARQAPAKGKVVLVGQFEDVTVFRKPHATTKRAHLRSSQP
jgi:modification methylase